APRGTHVRADMSRHRYKPCRPPRRARRAPARRCRPGGFRARPGVASLPYSGAMTPPQPASSHNAPPGGSNRGEGEDLTRRMDLVMEGGGVKGIALAGALEVLEERGYSVNRVA